MSTQTVLTEHGAAPRRTRFQFDKRYLAPLLVTIVLVVGQVTPVPTSSLSVAAAMPPRTPHTNGL